MRDCHERFPAGTFVKFAIAGHNVRGVVLFVKTCRISHAESKRGAVSQRTGGRVKTFDLIAVKVHSETAAGKVEGFEFFFVDKTEVGEHTRKENADVSFGHDASVAVGIVGVLRVEIHILVIKSSEDVGCAHAAADMPAGTMRGVKTKFAQFVSLFFKSYPLLFS